MNLTKQEIIDRISVETGLTREQSRSAVESVLEAIKSSLEKEDHVLISGFGRFTLRNKGVRRGRNLHTGAELMLRERKVVTFRCSGILRGKVNASS